MNADIEKQPLFAEVGDVLNLTDATALGFDSAEWPNEADLGDERLPRH